MKINKLRLTFSTPTKLKHIFLLLILSMLWSSLFVFVKIGDQNMSPFSLMAGRAIMGFVFIFFVIFAQKKTNLIKENLRLNTQMLFLFNGICISFMWFSIAKSEQVLTTAMASFLLTTMVLFSWIIGIFFTKEKLFYFLNLCGILISVVAISTMLGLENIFHGNKSVWSSGLYAMGVLVFVIGATAIKQYGSKVPAIVSMVYSLFYAMIILILCAFIFENPLQETYNVTSMVSIIGVGIFCTGIAYLIFFYLVAQEGQIFSSLTSYLVPIFGFIFGVLFMQESYSLHQIFALLIVFVGMFFINLDSIRHNFHLK